MSTVEALQQQLADLKRRNEEELASRMQAFDAVNSEILELQELTDKLEEEEQELESRFGSRRPAQQSHAKDSKESSGLFQDIVVGLVDVDDARCKR